MFRKIADVKRERELAEIRKNEGLDQLGSDHPVRKLISKFRKISHENRVSIQNVGNLPASSTTGATTVTTTTTTTSAPITTTTTTVQSTSSGTNGNAGNSTTSSSEPTMTSPSEQTTPLLVLPPLKPRDKLETISERIETQPSQISQITSVNQSPPLQRPPKSSKWKWLKTGSTGPETDSPPQGTLPTIRTSPPQPSKNPFDSNVNDDELNEVDAYGNPIRPNIPMSLFIPRRARPASSGNMLEVEIDESHSDINNAFAARHSFSSSHGDQQIYSSLIEVKNTLSTEVRALSSRISHIDDQINRIFQYLVPLESVTNNKESRDSTQVISPTSALLMIPNENKNPQLMEQLDHVEESPAMVDLIDHEALSDTNQSSSSVSELQSQQSGIRIRKFLSSKMRQKTVEHEATALSIPPPPSVYNRSSNSSMILTSTPPPRGAVSNKIAPAPMTSSAAVESSQSDMTSSFRAMASGRAGAARSPKSKLRSQPRIQSKSSQQSSASTIIDLEHDSTEEKSSKSGTGKSTSRVGSQVFRRFMTSASQSAEKKHSQSTTLLYPPTSDEDRPTSPLSSGNDDDDYRPLTSISSSKPRHQTPL